MVLSQPSVIKIFTMSFCPSVSLPFSMCTFPSSILKTENDFQFRQTIKSPLQIYFHYFIDIPVPIQLQKLHLIFIFMMLNWILMLPVSIKRRTSDGTEREKKKIHFSKLHTLNAFFLCDFLNATAYFFFVNLLVFYFLFSQLWQF